MHNQIVNIHTNLVALNKKKEKRTYMMMKKFTEFSKANDLKSKFELKL
jgi:hypothetical protein